MEKTLSNINKIKPLVLRHLTKNFELNFNFKMKLGKKEISDLYFKDKEDHKFSGLDISDYLETVFATTLEENKILIVDWVESVYQELGIPVQQDLNINFEVNYYGRLRSSGYIVSGSTYLTGGTSYFNFSG